MGCGIVLNWDVSNTMSTEWCTKVLSETIQKHGAPIIFNTDQGSQYTSEAHNKALKNNDIKISVNEKGGAIVVFSFGFRAIPRSMI